MQLSRKADYALRAVRHLAGLKKGTLASINDISEAESIPREFLAKILFHLSQSSILVSYRGVNGGYCLANTPKNTSYLDVIEEIEGPIHLSLCTEESNCGCDQNQPCQLRSFWLSQEIILKKAFKKKNFSKYHAPVRRSAKSRKKH